MLLKKKGIDMPVVAIKDRYTGRKITVQIKEKEDAKTLLKIMAKNNMAATMFEENKKE